MSTNSRGKITENENITIILDLDYTSELKLGRLFN